MEALNEFTKEFTDHVFEAVEDNGSLYTVTDIPSNSAPVLYRGTRLGTLKRRTFYPTIPLLNMIESHTDRVAVINEKSAWLFICGKNILKEGIISCSHDEGHVLIKNEKGDLLGYGKITGAGITNKYDVGDYLRRER